MSVFVCVALGDAYLLVQATMTDSKAMRKRAILIGSFISESFHIRLCLPHGCGYCHFIVVMQTIFLIS